LLPKRRKKYSPQRKTFSGGPWKRKGKSSAQNHPQKERTGQKSGQNQDLARRGERNTHESRKKRSTSSANSAAANLRESNTLYGRGEESGREGSRANSFCGEERTTRKSRRNYLRSSQEIGGRNSESPLRHETKRIHRKRLLHLQQRESSL